MWNLVFHTEFTFTSQQFFNNIKPKPEGAGANYETLGYFFRKIFNFEFVVEIFLYRVVLYVVAIMRIEENEIIKEKRNDKYE